MGCFDILNFNFFNFINFYKKYDEIRLFHMMTQKDFDIKLKNK